MIETQWRMHQRKKKDAFEVESLNKSDSVKVVKRGQANKRSVTQRLLPLLSPLLKSKYGKVVPNKDEGMVIENFDSGSEKT